MNRSSPAPRRADLPAGEEAEAGEDLAMRQRERMEEAALLAAMPDSFLTVKLRLKISSSAQRSAVEGDCVYQARQSKHSVALRFFWRGLYGYIIRQVSSLECGVAW